MSSGAVVAAGQRSHHLYAWFDHEAAAVRSGQHSVWVESPQLAFENLHKMILRFCVMPTLCVCAGGDHPVGAVPVVVVCPTRLR